MHALSFFFFSSSSKSNQLVNSGSPVFVSINGRGTIHLFVGCSTAAVADTERSIFYITSGGMRAGRNYIEKTEASQHRLLPVIRHCVRHELAESSVQMFHVVMRQVGRWFLN